MPRAQRAPHPSWQAPYPVTGGPTMQVPMHTQSPLPQSRPHYEPHQHYPAYGQGPVAPMSQQGYPRFADPHMQSHQAHKVGPGAVPRPQRNIPAQQSVGAVHGLGANHPATLAGANTANPVPGVRYDAPSSNSTQAIPPRFATEPHGAPIAPVAAVPQPGRGPQGPYPSQGGVYGADAHQQTHAPAMASRIASANAAIAAIQSVAPPLVPPMPHNRPTMAMLGLPQLPGGDLKGRIKFEHNEATKVVDEVTAQKSAAEFSSFLANARKVRGKQWDDFWRHRPDLNRRILVLEDECFNEAQEDSAENEYSDDEDMPRRIKPVTVPYMYHNTGSFDIPPARPVVMPDPEAVMLQMQQVQAQQAQAQQAQVSSQAHQLRVQQAQVQAQRSALSARQRAAQQVKPYRNY